ncbi:helix-turn-helix transcriptional regulator [[Clostridium] symbiosum]|uniref:helix-turn-helix domain-containing protein n=1 Tax=Clostridium symbiosum TaxID=1512 RepID=UPI001D089997|nr:helix-turn-helix transcriptional regulator [[Clostridium] symbiosum]MCB6609473.1 helix-turn-helix transcriptional regulator [[Clostridium] symbiosum]MCB6929534.1 helix-turn-helix transcriptional regulator [[Clostridium] symbiosum]
MITFEPFWDTLKRKRISQYDLIHKYHMSRGMLDNLKHNRSITLNTLNDLCNTYDCDITDVIKFEKEESDIKKEVF